MTSTSSYNRDIPSLFVVVGLAALQVAASGAVLVVCETVYIAARHRAQSLRSLYVPAPGQLQTALHMSLVTSPGQLPPRTQHKSAVSSVGQSLAQEIGRFKSSAMATPAKGLCAHREVRTLSASCCTLSLQQASMRTWASVSGNFTLKLRVGAQDIVAASITTPL